MRTLPRILIVDDNPENLDIFRTHLGRSSKRGGSSMRGRGHLLRRIFAGMVAGLLLAGPVSALQLGQKAPAFTLPAPGGKQVKLADLLGKGPVVIYTFVQAFADL